MIEYRCPTCEALAYSAASEVHVGGCPSCGVQLREVGLASRPQPSLRELLPEESIFTYARPGEMNLSVRAARRA
jgi:predicted  nucleic acid-binding Zn-ribbon protein